MLKLWVLHISTIVIISRTFRMLIIIDLTSASTFSPHFYNFVEINQINIENNERCEKLTSRINISIINKHMWTLPQLYRKGEGSIQ